MKFHVGVGAALPSMLLSTTAIPNRIFTEAYSVAIGK
jgi:hypothetical protein